nr:MAG TPA: hypothetical protein [Caudoviricetes sp.]
MRSLFYIKIMHNLNFYIGVDVIYKKSIYNF